VATDSHELLSHNHSTRWLGVLAINLQNKRGPKCHYDNIKHPLIIKWMSRNGATDEDIANEIGISVRQLYRWYKDYPELCHAKEDKLLADMRVEDSLYKLALGYEVEETEIIANKDGRPAQIKKTKKHIPASLKACRMWLINRQPSKWLGKPD